MSQCKSNPDHHFIAVKDAKVISVRDLIDNNGKVITGLEVPALP